MLRKWMALGALALSGAAYANGGVAHNPPSPGDQGFHDSNPGNDGSKKDGSGFSQDNGGDTLTLVFPSFCSDRDVIKWVKDLDRCDKPNVFEELLHAVRHDDFDLPKCGLEVLKDITKDIDDLQHDLDKREDHEHEDCDLEKDIKSDAKDIRKDVHAFEYILQNGCDDCHDGGCTAVPLPPAVAQGAMGFGMLGLGGAVVAFRRRQRAKLA